MEENNRPRIWAMKHNAKLTKKDPNARVYFEQMDAILESENLLNIAITGNRGSGKSSIIHSYDNYRNEGKGERFLYISLAEFEHYVEEAAKESEEQSNPDKGLKETTNHNPVEEVVEQNAPPAEEQPEPEAVEVVVEQNELPAEEQAKTEAVEEVVEQNTPPAEEQAKTEAVEEVVEQNTPPAEEQAKTEAVEEVVEQNTPPAKEQAKTEAVEVVVEQNTPPAEEQLKTEAVEEVVEQNAPPAEEQPKMEAVETDEEENRVSKDAEKPDEKIKTVQIKKPLKPKGKEREEIQKKLEYSMLSQILTKCTRRDLRNSSLKAIPEVREARRGVAWVYGYAFLLFMLICGLKYEEHFAKFLQKDYLETLFPRLMALLETVFPKMMQLLENNQLTGHGLGYVLACGMVFVGGACLLQRKPGLFRLGKVALKLPWVEAETSPSQNVFCLDHYRFELIHILNQLATKIDYTVVIEDLELVGECCAEEIMSKLRELNMQVNTHRQTQYNAGSNLVAKAILWARYMLLKQKYNPNGEDVERVDPLGDWFRFSLWRGSRCAKPIRFVYAISDATFDEEERTKFFDTILPVTPALNHKNAFEITKNLFTGRLGMSDLEAKLMVKMMSNVVTDYRQINDIKTEYEFFSRWYRESDPLGLNGNTRELTVWEKLSRWKKRNKISDETENGNAQAGAGSVSPDSEKLRNERCLLAIAVYKALLPLEYHYAFTRKGGGILINPRTEQIEGKKYDEKVIELIDFLFKSGYLDAESLVLIGYSREVLRKQWEEILLQGTPEEREDLVKRFDPDNSHNQEPLSPDVQGVLKENLPRYPYLEKEIKAIQRLEREIYKTAEDALVTYYARLLDKNLGYEELANMLIGLDAFADISNARKQVNKGNDFKNFFGKDFLTGNYIVELDKKMKAAQRVYKTNEDLKIKFQVAVPVIALLLGMQGDEGETAVKKKYSLGEEKKK